MNINCASSPVASRRSPLLPILLATAVLTACQKSETVPTTAERLKHVEQKQQTEPDFYVPRRAVDYMSDLKSIKENTPKLPLPAAAANAPPPAPKADAKPSVAELKSAAPAVSAPVAAPVQTASAASVVASPAPTARPAPAKEVAPALTVISREPPEFPRDAIRAGIESGRVRARLSINAAGGVSEVVIVEARPVRVFNRAVTEALLRWKFNPGTDGRTFETEINFKL